MQKVSKTGGHLASNLGIVELTVALEYCFHLPEDKIVWDVGHQAYIHKMLTGRKEDFDHLRQLDGLSGFPKPTESDCDAFATGHSSTSISAAFGLAKARDLTGGKEHVIAVIGDGSMTGGLAYIRQGRVVSAPKASRLMKLAQRPMHWPSSRPITARSVMAPILIFLCRV